jgi:hypothetical protein
MISRRWALAAAGAFAAGLSLVVWQGGSPEPARDIDERPPPALPEPPVAEAPPPVDADRTQPAPAPRAPAVAPQAPATPRKRVFPDDWFDADTPPLLADAFERTAGRRRRLDPRVAIEIYHYAKAHPDDARAPLVMGYDSMNRGWMEMGLDHYIKAYRAEPDIRRDPRMLEDLLDVAQVSFYHDKAVDAIDEIYGVEALEAVERRLAHARETGEVGAVAQLEKLREALH